MGYAALLYGAHIQSSLRLIRLVTGSGGIIPVRIIDPNIGQVPDIEDIEIKIPIHTECVRRQYARGQVGEIDPMSPVAETEIDLAAGEEIQGKSVSETVGVGARPILTVFHEGIIPSQRECQQTRIEEKTLQIQRHE